MAFDDWFYEQEGFALRAERFHTDLEMFHADELTNIDILRWLKAAYEEGYNQSRYNTIKLYWDDGK